MKIIAGKYRGHDIGKSKGPGLRPTANLVREAVFNVIGMFLIDKTVMDVFAGTGAYGFEALSRGAGSVVFVDNDPKVCSGLKQTGHKLGVENVMRAIRAQALTAVKNLLAEKAKFSIIFLDPPYFTDDMNRVTGFEDFTQLLTDEGLLVCESHVRSRSIAPPAGMIDFFSRKYGETVINIFRFDEVDQPETE